MPAKKMSSSKIVLSKDLKLVEFPKGTKEGQEEVGVVEETINLDWYPVNEEAHAWLVEKREGAHPFINYFSKSMAVMVAKVIGRQITLDEVKFFVGLDGDGVCFAKKRQITIEINDRIDEINRECDRQIGEIEGMDSELYSPEIKEEEIVRLNTEADEKVEKLKEDLQDTNSARFTRVWIVVPWMNPRLLEELEKNGGDIPRTFMHGDIHHGIYRSGSIYETDKGNVEASGSFFFFNPVIKIVRIATSPLGRMSVLHPKACNSKKSVDVYYGTGWEARQTQLKQIFGISNKEMERREKLRKTGVKDTNERITFRMDDTILSLFGEQRVSQAKPRTGRGCK